MKKWLLFDFTTQRWVELAKLANPIVNYMSWSQDGKYLYFDSLSQDNPAIFRVRISDRRLEPVVSLKDFRREWGSWSPWFGLAPDDSPLLLRRAGSRRDLRPRLGSSVRLAIGDCRLRAINSRPQTERLQELSQWERPNRKDRKEVSEWLSILPRSELTHELKRMDKKRFECGSVDGSVLNGNATASVPYP